MTQEQKDNLCDLPTVGPSKEQLLNNHEYMTYEDLSQAHPVSLNQECDIVLASATQIIVSAINQLEVDCPECGESNLEPAWSSASIDPVSESSDIQCTSCSWDGRVDETDETSEKTVPTEIQ